ncbi:MAG: RluA family pseudouridine synthase [Lachnospiraceae bacterium]|nr:RluA family pseudouridine synthase [Lachnospiraceae bacterium]
MERILHYPINIDSDGITISEFLKKHNFSSQNITHLKKMPQSVLVNGQWKYMNTLLYQGDHLTIHIQEMSSNSKILPCKLPFPILYEDEDLVVINKPYHMPIHPSQNNYDNTLANAAAYYYEVLQNTPFIYRCINRLDKDTSGLTILAKNMYSAGLLASQMQRGEIKRFYVAVVKGIFPFSYGKITAPIGRKPGSTIERMVDELYGEKSITYYHKLQTFSHYTLMALRLKTGRTHQIRVHMSHLGYPLLGDSLYDPECDLSYISRQALHAARIIFQHPVTGKKVKLDAPLPEDMISLLHP